MPTTKQRINITTNREVETALKMSAKRDRVPVASKAAELLRLALEIEEGRYFAEIARRRDTPDAKYISHDAFWKKIRGK